MQMLLPSIEFECMGQFVHVTSDVWPVSALYLPMRHSRHALEPFTSLYFPLPQAVQFWPSGPVYPTVQAQPSLVALPGVETELAGQLMHAADPAVALYLPAAHATHSPPSARVYPMLQAQSPATVLPGVEFEFGGQDRHPSS